MYRVKKSPHLLGQDGNHSDDDDDVDADGGDGCGNDIDDDDDDIDKYNDVTMEKMMLLLMKMIMMR